MNRALVGRRWVTLLSFLLLGTPQLLHAQLSEVELRLHGGIATPMASTGDYFRFGPSVAVDVAYPLMDRLDVNLDLVMDWFNTADIYATPTTNLWRYRAAVEADLLGDTGDAAFLVRALAGAGGTTIRSHKFWLASRRPYTYDGETINQTAVTMTGGLRLGLRTPDDLTWWLTGKLDWSPLQDINQDALRELARNQLDPLGSALSLSITLGVTVF
jgi:hypothetical protein